MMHNKARSFSKRFAKKSIRVTRKLVAKNKILRKGAVFLRNALIVDTTSQLYNYAKYAPSIAEYQKQLAETKEFKNQPLISIVTPTYNTNITYLVECIESVLIQSYSNWEFCIADDASPDKEVIKTLDEYAAKDSRIKVVKRKQNGHISVATNSAISIATGEYTALLDHDDVLWPNALYEIVKVINAKPETDFIYTDEDKLNEDGETHSYPFLKPDWSPEFLESCNYITHFSCIRTSLIKEVGGLRKGYEGAQDWDLFLRIAEKTTKIIHIPKILYSWRIHEASTASDTDAKPYVYEAQRKLLEDHVERSELKGVVKQGIIKQHSCIEYGVINNTKVSIIIAVNNADDLKKCLLSLRKNTNYDNLEIILAVRDKRRAYAVANKVMGSVYKVDAAVITGEASRANMFKAAAAQAKGGYLCFVDSSFTFYTPNWLELLLGDAQREGVGLVGGKTLSVDRDRFLRSAIGLGVYGLYAPLLEWMPVDDIHYMRGLYGQSRRNVAAIDSGCVIVKHDAYNEVGGIDEKTQDMCIVDLCLKMISSGRRNVYNPFVAMVDLHNTTAGDSDKQRSKQDINYFQQKWHKYIEYDPYLNPSFTRSNGQLGVQ